MPRLRLPLFRICVALLVLGLATAAAGCGAGASATAPTTGQVCCAPPADGPDTVDGIATAHDGWDLAFIDYFASHDAVAGQMAALAQAQAASQAVKDIATKIDAEPGDRFLRLAAMAKAWGEPVPSTDPATAGGHDHGGGRTEADDLEELTPLKGAAFDHVFLQVLVRHHQAGIAQAQATIDNGTNPQTREVAQRLVTDQTPQLQQLRAMARTI